MPVPRVRKIYYLIETAVWFLFICVKFHCALPGSLHRKSSAQRVHWSQPHTFTGPPKWHSRFGMRQTYQTVFTFQTWNSGLTNAVERPQPNCIPLWMKMSSKRNVSEGSSETVTEAEYATKTLKWTSNLGFVFLVVPYFQKKSNIESVQWLAFSLLH